MIGTLRTALALLFATAVLYGLQQTRPRYSQITSPIVTTGGMNERVQTGNFALSLDSVRVARALDVETFGKTKAYTTPGVWVVVEGMAEARYETLSLTSADWISKAGVRYALTDRIPATIEMLPGDVNQPGLPRRALLVFEMPQDAVAGGSVAVTRSKLSPLDDEVQIAVDADTDRTEPKITLRRNNEGFPWTVLPQR